MNRRNLPRPPAEIPMTGVKSSSIASFGYDEASRTLAVTFRNGKAYRYAEVPPAVVAQLRDADSFGGFVNKRIVGRYDLVRDDD